MMENGNLRMTRQRKLILAELMRVKSHPTADELHRMVRRKLPHISLATVYRNLELLAGQGLIRKIEGGPSQMRFDGDTSRHFHSRCRLCGRVFDADFAPGISIEGIVSDALSRGALDVNIEFIIECDACAKNRMPEPEAKVV